MDQDVRGGSMASGEPGPSRESSLQVRGVDSSDDPRLRAGSSGTSGGVAGRDVPFSTGPRPSGPGANPNEPLDLGPRFRPWSEPASSGAGPTRCQFLRSVGPDGKLTDAQNQAVPAHRCAAFGDPLPLSLRQQELVCLQRVHVSCPRYARGTVLAGEIAASAPTREDRWSRVSLLTLVGIGLVILAIATLLTGLLGLPPFGGGKPVAAIPTVSPSARASPTPPTAPSLTAIPSAQASASAVATPGPTPTPTVTLTPQPTAVPQPTASWPPGATASRMSLLVPCTDQADCYVYTIRGPGPAPAGNGSAVADTLAGVARYFGVSLAAIEDMNPWLGGSATVHPGDKLKIPPPTR